MKILGVLALWGFILVPVPDALADLHLLPDGAGRKDGSSWENAIGPDEVRSLLASGLAPGDRLLVGGGRYRGAAFTLAVSGMADRPIVIEGVDQGGGLPVFESDWDEKKPDRGEVALEIKAAASHLTIRNLRFRGFVVGVNARAAGEGGTRTGLRFEKLAFERVRHGFYLSDCDDLAIEACEVRRYTKHAFRLEGGCDRVRFRDCVADCSEGDEAWEKLTESLPFGFFINGAKSPNSEIDFEHCLAQNNLMPLQTNSYKNGDGFVVEEKNLPVRFLGCRSFRNQDGGFDLKPSGVVLRDCVAKGNGRNFRLWDKAVMENCFSGWAPTGLWTNGGAVRVDRTTFFALTGAPVETGDDSTGPVALRDCLLAAVEQPVATDGKGSVDLDSSNIVDSSSGGNAAGFAKVDSEWQGDNAAMDSGKHPGKGWRYRAGRGVSAKP